MNSKSKNLIIAALVTAIYYTNIVKGIPTEKVVIAIVCIFVGAVAIMELYDGIDMLRYGTKSFLTKFRFRMYKQKVEAKVEKDLRNGINRRVNCETANLTKVVDASLEQMSAIRRLEEMDRLDTLAPKLKQTAMLRMENPEATLSELAQMFDPPVTKSAMNHRMRKIIELAKN